MRGRDPEELIVAVLLAGKLLRQREAETKRKKPVEAKPPQLKEKDFQARVVQYARLRGWRVMHHWNSMHSPAGWPDLFMVKDGRALAIELKVGKNLPTTAQLRWLDALDALPGVRACVIWSEDEDMLYRLLDGPHSGQGGAGDGLL